MSTFHTPGTIRHLITPIFVVILLGVLGSQGALGLGVSTTAGHARDATAGGGALRPAATCGQAVVPLASTASYAVLASSTVTSTGATVLTGDLGLSPGTSVTGFPPGKITGTQNVTTPGAAGAEANLTIAYNNAAGRSNCPVTVAGNIGGQTLAPGLYKSTSSLAISSGDLTLSGGGNPNAVFVFQVASSFTTTSGRAVVLTGGAQAGNVFWQIGSSATIGTTSTMKGTILAHSSISFLTGSSLTGRAMVETGQISLAGATITVPTTSSVTTYAVTFTESGLPAATSWDVTYGGVDTSSTTTSIVFEVVAGSYAFTVNLAGYIADPASGTVAVSSGPASQAISFSAGASGTFSVTYTESGLPAGTTWWVTSGGVLGTSSTTTIAFNVASGTYTYAVGVVSNYTASPSSGSVTVNGAAAGQSVAFSALGGGGTPSGPAGGSSGLTTTEWALLALIIIAIVAAIIGAIAWSRRAK
jgi:hypothetical protein